jgi:tetratricopeptide (TPR) repeat protein
MEAVLDASAFARPTPPEPVALRSGEVAVALGVLALALLEADGSAAAASALAEAKARYRDALTLAPKSASAWFGLGGTLARMGRRDDALLAFEAARRFGWSDSLDVALARLRLERGERDRAVALLRPIAQAPHGGAAQEEPEELLEEALR